MKKLCVLLLLSIAYTMYAQDKIILNDGYRYTGNITAVSRDSITIITSKNTYTFSRTEIESFNIADENKKKELIKTIPPIKDTIQNNRIVKAESLYLTDGNKAGKYLIHAGSNFTAGALIPFIGYVFGAVFIASESPEAGLATIGGCSIIGFVCYLSGANNLKKAGDEILKVNNKVAFGFNNNGFGVKLRF